MRSLVCGAGAAAILLGATLGCGAQAQTYPSRPVRVIVPLAPGGSMDTIARALAQKLTEAMGQNFIVGSSPEAFRAHIGAERSQWASVIKQAGIRGQ